MSGDLDNLRRPIKVLIDTEHFGLSIETEMSPGEEAERQLHARTQILNERRYHCCRKRILGTPSPRPVPKEKTGVCARVS